MDATYDNSGLDIPLAETLLRQLIVDISKHNISTFKTSLESLHAVCDVREHDDVTNFGRRTVTAEELLEDMDKKRASYFFDWMLTLDWNLGRKNFEKLSVKEVLVMYEAERREETATIDSPPSNSEENKA